VLPLRTTALLPLAALALCTIYTACGSVVPTEPPDASTTIDAGVDASFGARPNVAFLTSALYMGDIGGASGADQICKTHAATAGLAGDFVAMIQDATRTDPTTLLAASSGWTMLDGRWLAQTPAQVANGQWIHPLTTTDVKSTIDPYTDVLVVWAGTMTNACSDWTTNSTQTTGIIKGLLGWGSFGQTGESVKCNKQYRLACFERGNQATRIPPVLDQRLVFVSNGTWRPSTGGRDSADFFCANEALTAGRRGRFVALLPMNASAAITRINPPITTKFQRSDGELIGLLTSLKTYIMLDATGQPVVGPTWTGGFPDQVQLNTCNQWTSSTAGSAIIGLAGTISNSAYLGDVATGQLESCNNAAHLYCIQQ
jgi:hypothetical protein